MGVLSWMNSVGNAGINAAYKATGGTTSTPGTLNPTFSANTAVVPNVGSETVYPSYTPNVNLNSGGASWMSGLGSVLGGAGSIIGGLLSYREQKEANKIAQQQFAEQMAFAKDQYYNNAFNRVQDARHAGVHPLAALGISPHGSASPTAHVQSATGLGHSLQALSGAVNSYFENAARSKQLELLTSQVQANQALAMKYKADTAHSIADTNYINKHVANYNVYRVWNSINGSLAALGRVVRPAPVFNRSTTFNRHALYQDIY